MAVNNSTLVLRKDYQASNHSIETVDLTFDLVTNNTVVTSKMLAIPREDRVNDDLVLDGENLELVSILINNEQIYPGQYDMQPGKLIIHDISDAAEIEIVTRINPRNNLELSGLYMSKNNYITQCEAQGFRRITFFPDRPDVQARYKVEIHAPKDYKVLLSNGNLLEEGNLPDGRRFAIWEDPFPKPSYLFAMVAGNFACNQDSIELMNGRKALLQIWTEPGNESKTAFAMESLKNAIRWDENRFGLTLDLDRFMIVATDDFNMGAMENKGLNIFNSKYVLANDQVATDDDFANIESVIGHEYFHNWTGDRVTCRDWFQLSLKEGLTVFREQEFAADLLQDPSAQVVKRIKDVRTLRTLQFPEDAGPMAHPVRPESYHQIDNFYTMTVYEKGAEVVRMYQTLFGKDGFRKGLIEYINRFDGTGATCDDFRTAMAEANGEDLTQFDLWYSQAGTPKVKFKSEWNEQEGKLKLTFKQSNRVFPGQPSPKPLMIPITIGVLNDKGEDIELHVEGEERSRGLSTTLVLTEAEQSWTLLNVTKKPVVSVGRNFSAPVIFQTDYTKEQLIFLAKNDSDLFNRAEAFQKLTMLVVDQFIAEIEKKGPATNISPSESYLFTFEDILNNKSLSPAYKAEVLSLPSENLVAENQILINPRVIREALDLLRKRIGQRLKSVLEEKVKLNETPGIYKPTPLDAGKRALKHLALSYLVAAQDPKSIQTTRRLYEKANNLTDRLASLKIAISASLPVGDELLRNSLNAWQDDPLLTNKWLQLQSGLRSKKGENPVVLTIRALMFSPVFDPKNPNKVYSLLGTFFKNGGPEFHREDGQGYQLWVDTVLQIDKFNPQVASRSARSMENWRRYEPKLASMMYKALRYVSKHKDLSTDVREVIDKAINEPV